MSSNPYWQLLGWVLLIAFFATLAGCIHRSSRYEEEEGVCPAIDDYTYNRLQKDIWPQSLLGE
jgi:hypothetical protein